MKTAELTGAQLDYWVAKAEGWHKEVWGNGPDEWEWRSAPTAEDPEGMLQADDNFTPSTVWDHGGPIIGRERISFIDIGWTIEAGYEPEASGLGIAFMGAHAEGPTHLIAAMRAYVASKFGKEVPDEAQP